MENQEKITLNGNNSSGDTPQFSKSRFAILEKLHKLRNWIKLLFLPIVAKRSSASELSDLDLKSSSVLGDIVIYYDSDYVYYKDKNIGEFVMPYSMYKDMFSDFIKSSKKYY